MKVLIVKLSSLGDIIHTLPAVCDASKIMPDIEFHWVVEKGFQTVANWGPNVKRIIPIELRRWRKQKFLGTCKEIISFIKQLRQERYDLIIDAQGLLKSALVARLAKGKTRGFSFYSAREPWASYLYHQALVVGRNQHAVVRSRQLFALSLGYCITEQIPQDFINCPNDNLPFEVPNNSILFFHGTTWTTKYWPEAYWVRLANLVQKNNLTVLLPWGNQEEKSRAERIVKAAPGAFLLPTLSLTQMVLLLQQVKACISVDTGLGHLAATVGTPSISLYGPTDPNLVGIKGANQYHLRSSLDCAPCFKRTCSLPTPFADAPPCFQTVTVDQVWQKLQVILANHATIVSEAKARLCSMAWPNYKTAKQQSLIIMESLIDYWSQLSFDAVMATSGNIYRQIERRTTLSFQHHQQTFFIKKSLGLGWRELFKNLLQWKLPTFTMRTEYQAIRRAAALGIATPVIAGFGHKGSNPLAQHSFVITKGIDYDCRLDELAEQWAQKSLPFSQKLLLLQSVASTVRTMHRNYLYHRDLYACHFFLKKNANKITLLDWHRAKMCHKKNQRWLVKDLAALYYSVQPFALTKRDLFRFIAFYCEKSWHQALSEDSVLWQAVVKRTKKFICQLDN